MRKNKIRFTIKTKLSVTFLLILLVPSLVIGFIAYQSAQSGMKQQMTATAIGNVELLNQTINQTIQAKEREIDLLSQNIAAGSLVNGKENPSVTSLLSSYQQSNPDLEQAYIGTDTGVMVNFPTSFKNPPGYDPRQRPWYQQAMQNKGNVIVTSPFVSKSSGQIVVSIAKVTADGKGVVCENLNLTDLGKVVNGVKIGEKGYAYLLSSDKKYLVHPTIKAGTAVEKGSTTDTLFSEQIGKFQFQSQGSTKEMVFATNNLTGWKIGGTMDSQEFVDAAKQIVNQILLVVAIALVLGVIIIYFVVSSITRPLQKIKVVAELISTGDLTEQIEHKQNNELGDVGNSFNSMVSSLRNVLTEVSETSVQLASASEQLTASAEQSAQASEHTAVTMQELAQGTEQQVRSIEQTDQTVKELATGVQQIAFNAQTVSQTATEASDIAQQGNLAIQKAVEQMNSISKSVNGSSVTIKNLGDHAQNIGQIVATIVGLSSQTNLLALNAAIEAARAGEHGRGFAVVADEVRKLAEQSSRSAHRIAEYISTIQNEIQNAVEAMAQGTEEVAIGIDVVHVAGSSFDQIQNAVTEVSKQIQEVSAAVQQMTAGAEQVSQSVGLITEVTQTAASGTQTDSASSEEQLASMEEITSSASALSEMAEQLESLIRKFKL
jgi:methyl-accepting chemotaxis protein